MKEKVISPTDYREIGNSPLIYLNGPNEGAPDWQQEAIKLISRLDTQQSIWIANPRYVYLDGAFVRREQTRWEGWFREKARDQGVNLFWLAKQVTPTPGRSYARTTRWELSESLGWYIHRSRKEPSKIAIGIEEGFEGEDFIRDRMGEVYEEVPIYSDLEYTCQMVVEEILKR